MRQTDIFSFCAVLASILCSASAQLLPTLPLLSGCNSACATNALCILNTCKCQAPAPDGDPHFWCFDKDGGLGADYVGCFARGDPHLTNFVGEKANFPVPCRHRLTEFFVNNVCYVQVFGVAVMTAKGQVYENTLEVHVSSGTENVLIFISRDQPSYYMQFGIKTLFQTGGGVPVQLQLTLAGNIVSVSYDTEKDIWTIESPPRFCDFTIKFRQYDEGQQASNQAPGIGIMVRMDPSYFLQNDSAFPNSLCARPQGMLTYAESITMYSIDSRSTAVIYAWLDTPVEQMSYQPFKTECEAAQSRFQTMCSGSRKTLAANACGSLLRAKSARCLRKNSYNVMAVFNQCIETFCSGLFQQCFLFQIALDGVCSLPDIYLDSCTALVSVGK